VPWILGKTVDSGSDERQKRGVQIRKDGPMDGIMETRDDRPKGQRRGVEVKDESVRTPTRKKRRFLPKL
jgi:hypothetical protein